MISFELLTDLENTFYEFETLLHCFNDCSLLYHIVRAQNVPPPLWPVRRRKDALSSNCTINCTLSNSSSTLWTRDWCTRCWTRQ